MSDDFSEGFRNVPNPSADFGTIPHHAEHFRTVRNDAERSEQHTLTVREVARLFEEAGVPRTERSIINWCQPNRQGIARIDAFFDTNERKYYITRYSVDAAIDEERSKLAKNDQQSSEPFGTVPQPAPKTERTNVADPSEIKELEREIMDLRIANRGKDQFIELLTKEREEFRTERGGHIDKLIGFSRDIGELSSKLLQLGAGASKLNSPQRRALDADSSSDAESSTTETDDAVAA